MVAYINYTKYMNKMGIKIVTNDGIYNSFFTEGVEGTPNALLLMERLIKDGYELRFIVWNEKGE